MSQPKLLISHNKLNLIVRRFALQLIEIHGDFSNTAIIGLQPRGIHLSKRLVEIITELQPETNLKYGELDHTFLGMISGGEKSLCQRNRISIFQPKI